MRCLSDRRCSSGESEKGGKLINGVGRHSETYNCTVISICRLISPHVSSSYLNNTHRLILGNPKVFPGPKRNIRLSAGSEPD
ncbi:hypothetical protein ILYODFUR_015385 [Ilyodon furcidens]|uniref:Uncharacterized protein n=1 Tax=Ilyodon furcidens TaxID=33524 RepID=A0ABV0U5M0_9TELE